VPDKVLGNHRKALFGANEGFDACPFSFEAFLFGLGFIFRQLGDFGVDLRFFVFVKAKLNSQ
jgi:hypothetical protein